MVEFRRSHRTTSDMIRILSWMILGLAACNAAAKPNMLFIFADDLGWRDVGFHGGRTATQTIDRIAKEGVELARCYAFPFCSPTRAALLTGRTPIRYGMVYTVIRPWSP